MRHGPAAVTSKKVRGSLLSAVVAGLCIFASQAGAADIYWDGLSGNWTALADWSTNGAATTPDPLAIPGSGDVAVFNIAGEAAWKQSTWTEIRRSAVGPSLTPTDHASGWDGPRSVLEHAYPWFRRHHEWFGRGGPGLECQRGREPQPDRGQTWNIGSGGLSVNGAITGGVAFTKSGAGTLNLGAGSAAAFAAITVAGGVLQFDRTSPAPRSPTIQPSPRPAAPSP